MIKPASMMALLLASTALALPSLALAQDEAAAPPPVAKGAQNRACCEIFPHHG